MRNRKANFQFYNMKVGDGTNITNIAQVVTFIKSIDKYSISENMASLASSKYVHTRYRKEVLKQLIVFIPCQHICCFTDYNPATVGTRKGLLKLIKNSKVAIQKSSW